MIPRSAPLPPLEIVAHRGASAEAPENTLPAIELAWNQQADAVEIDVQVSADGYLVAIHDDTTDRTTGQPGRVHQQSLAELKGLDAGAWKHPEYAGSRIPTLREAVELVPPGKRLFVELKCGPAGLPDLNRTLVDKNHPDTPIVLISFSLPMLRRTRQTLPQIPAYWVWDLKGTKGKAGRQVADRLLHLARTAGVQGLDLSAADCLDQSFVESVRNSGLHLGVWTVDDPSIARRLCDAGINSLTTNQPGRLRAHLETRETRRLGN